MFYPQRKCPVCQHDNFAVALIHKSNYEQMVVRRISRKQGSLFFLSYVVFFMQFELSMGELCMVIG